MKDKETNDSSWSAVFFVTGFSFLLFSGILKMLEGNLPKIFLWIGFGALFLGLSEWAGRLLAKVALRKRKHKKIHS